MKLDGRVALVTGSGRGIGKAIALTLAREGADVAVNYRTDSQSAETTIDEIIKMERQAIICQADVGNAEEIDSMVDLILQRFGKIDILVNNAGIPSQLGPVIEHSIEKWDDVVKVHLRGTYLCCHRIGQEMVQQQYGRIVNIASLAGMGGTAYRTDYGPAKAGILNLTQSLAVEWARYNIRVNSVSPGIIDTDLIDSIIETKEKTATNVEKARRRTPMRRSGTPEEVARVVLFLISDESSFVTGVNIPVDGGWTADIVGY